MKERGDVEGNEFKKLQKAYHGKESGPAKEFSRERTK